MPDKYPNYLVLEALYCIRAAANSRPEQPRGELCTLTVTLDREEWFAVLEGFRRYGMCEP
jgi:hypothetical protein